MPLPTRDEVPTDEKWDPSIVFDSPDEWNAAATAFEKQLDEIRAYEGHVVDDGETLLHLLDLVEDTRVTQLGTLHLYAFLTHYVDTENEGSRKRVARYKRLRAEMESALGFIEPGLHRAGRDRLETLITSTPGLEAHEAYLRRLLASADPLPSETESALATLGPSLSAGSDIGRAIIDGDVIPPTVETPDGDEVTVTPQAKSRLLQSNNRRFRREVHKRFRESLRAHRSGMAAAYVKRIQADCRLASVRGCDSALAMWLSGGTGGVRGSFPVGANETVIEGITNQIEPHHRLLQARSRRVDSDELQEWDRHVPLVAGESPAVEYDDAVSLILDSLAPLGESYVDRLETLLQERRVDVRQTANKRRGSKAIHISSAADGPFIALNYDDSLRALYLFTHELGHAMNRVLASNAQRPIDEGVPYHTMEVASFLHEIFLADHLATIWNSTNAQHAQAVFLAKLPLYRAACGARFVHTLHQDVADGAEPGPDALDEYHREATSRFDAPIALGENAGSAWQEIDLEREPYHAYLYAVGSLGALAVAQSIATDDLSAREYREMLARGRSVPANEAFAPALDFTKEATVSQGINGYSERVDGLLATLEFDDMQS